MCCVYSSWLCFLCYVLFCPTYVQLLSLSTRYVSYTCWLALILGKITFYSFMWLNNLLLHIWKIQIAVFNVFPWIQLWVLCPVLLGKHTTKPEIMLLNRLSVNYRLCLEVARSIVFSTPSQMKCPPTFLSFLFHRPPPALILLYARFQPLLLNFWRG